MIALLAAVCLMGTPGIQGKTLLEQVVPRPTGRNGYEEYLRAAQIVTGDASLYLSWALGTPAALEANPLDPDSERRMAIAKRLEKMTLLEVRREAVRRCGTALDWVKQGNSKPVFDPRERIDVVTLFPELAQFKSLAKFAMVAAYVYDADGNSSKATETLLDALTMSQNINSRTLISYLVGVACQAIVLASFQTRLDRMSEADALRVCAFVTQQLERPSALVAALLGEARFLAASADELLKAPNEGLDGLGVEGDGFKRLTLAQRADVVRRLKAKLQAQYEEILLRFQGPESDWVFEDPPAVENRFEPQTPEEIAEVLSQVLSPAMSQVGTTGAKERTQMRLMRLAARVIAFKWRHERLPSTLADAAPAAEIVDPLTGGVFEYTPMSDRFRVYSKGVPATGEIDIKYVRNRRDSEPPPPEDGSARIDPRFGSQGDSPPRPLDGMNLLKNESSDESAHSQRDRTFR